MISLKKNKSSYSRIFNAIILVLFCVLLALGFTVFGISTFIFRNSELDGLRSTGEFFASCVSDEYSHNIGNFSDSVNFLIDKISSEQGIRISMYDENGKCLFTCDGSADSTSDLSKRTIGTLDKKDYMGLNSEFLSQSRPTLMFGTKFFLLQSNGNFVCRYLIAYQTTDTIDNFSLAILVSYSVSAFIFFAAAFVLLRRRFRKNIVFEEEFLQILEKYSKDDFSEKLSTDLSPNLTHICDLVNTLASHVETSSETSSTFISNVSHELRTPMTTIGGFVDGILDGTIKKSRQQEYLILVSQEIQRLRILITSMLNMSRFESGTLQPNFRETNLTDLVIKVVLMFEKRIEEKNLQVEELDSNRLTAVVDADLMQQVIYNLVENAVKFVNEGGTLSFSFDKIDDVCIIGIRNTGEGLKNSEIQQVFDRFYKTDSSRGKDKTGLGLGLSISRKIVHLHNGHIVVKSVYGEYTEFQIQIPTDPKLGDKGKK